MGSHTASNKSSYMCVFLLVCVFLSVCVCVAAYHKMFNKTQLPHSTLPLSLSSSHPISTNILYMSHNGIWFKPTLKWAKNAVKMI